MFVRHSFLYYKKRGGGILKCKLSGTPEEIGWPFIMSILLDELRLGFKGEWLADAAGQGDTYQLPIVGFKDSHSFRD